jgi:hypothetical protein
MRNLFNAAVLAAATAAVALPTYAQIAEKPDSTKPAAEKAQADVPVKVVVLFSSGVGYFEHGGTVKGTTSTELRFKTNQINDILKSLLLQDMGGGKVTTVVYPSQDPINKTLKSFQVDITGDPSLAQLLAQLRGAKVKVAAGPQALEGTILSLEKRPKPTGDKGSIDVWVLNLIAGGTIRSVELAEARSIQLEDPQLQEELNKALAALAQARDQDKKPVTIHFAGDGERQVRIGYVVETPVWKTSYRLVLPGQGQDKDKANAKPDKPRLLGWAIVENQTDNDWNNVQLSLVSGRPISFIQDLYQPLYIPRPVVQPELYASLRPQTYDAGMRSYADRVAEVPAAPPAAGKPVTRMRADVGRTRSESLRDANFDKPADLSLALGEKDEKQLAAPINPTASVASLASASKIGELFQYTVGSVSLPRQRSAMIPIITDDVEVEKLSIYNPTVLPRNPLNGARVRNTTGKHLLQGPVTVIEGSSYAGDARIDNVPPGQERLISYGVDLQMLVDAKNNKHEDAIIAGKIVKGVLWVTHKNVFTQDYHAENKSDHDKTLIIEHPFRPDWKLVEPAKPIEKTDTLYRFKEPVPAGKTADLRVVEEHVNAQQIAILPTDVGTLDFYRKTGAIPKSVRDVLEKAIAMKNALTDTQRQIEERRRHINDINNEQQRIRENLKTIDRNSDYGTRLIKKLNDQETTIEKLQGEIKDLTKTQNTQRQDLETYLQNTTTEDK